jgi:aspartyl-tRNA(Asn)/glutamyl-tRNA(Gln) amidotransferase subunit C
MSEFDSESLSNLENLCKIKLTGAEKVEFVKKLKKILSYVEQLNEVDTDNVNACNYVLMDMQKNVFREDIDKNTLDRDTFLKNSPNHIAGMIKVPEILSQKE